MPKHYLHCWKGSGANGATYDENKVYKSDDDSEQQQKRISFYNTYMAMYVCIYDFLVFPCSVLSVEIKKSVVAFECFVVHCTLCTGDGGEQQQRHRAMHQNSRCQLLHLHHNGAITITGVLLVKKNTCIQQEDSFKPNYSSVP